MARQLTNLRHPTCANNATIAGQSIQQAVQLTWRPIVYVRSTTSVPKPHIQISPGCTPPMISRYQAAYTGAQKCQITLKLPCFLSLPPSPQIFCAAARHIYMGIYGQCIMYASGCTLPAALYCWAGQYASPYRCLQFLPACRRAGHCVSFYGCVVLLVARCALHCAASLLVAGGFLHSA